MGSSGQHSKRRLDVAGGPLGIVEDGLDGVLGRKGGHEVGHLQVLVRVLERLVDPAGEEEDHSFEPVGVLRQQRA